MVKILVFSWNIGKKPFEKHELLNKYFNTIKGKTLKHNPEIVVLGFQEVPTNKQYILNNKSQEIFNYHEDIQDKLDYINISNEGTCLFGFRIVTLIFCKNDFKTFRSGTTAFEHYETKTNKLVQIDNTLPICTFKGTKGFTIDTLRFSHYDDPIYIVNTHMPFESLEKSQNFFKEIQDKLSEHKNANIIFGDLNSRSLLTSDCYKKNIKSCHESSSDDYCQFINNLQELQETRKIDTTSTHNGGNICNPAETCDDGDSLKTINSREDIIQHLLQKDTLKCNLKDFSSMYSEGDIHFLPTYKRDPHTGKFALFKGKKQFFSPKIKKKGRLPGYADRIIFSKDKFKSEEYDSIWDQTGNDHLPIFGLLEYPKTISKVVNGSGSRNKYTKKRKRKTKKTKKNRKNRLRNLF